MRVRVKAPFWGGAEGRFFLETQVVDLPEARIEEIEAALPGAIERLDAPKPKPKPRRAAARKRTAANAKADKEE